MRSVQQNAPGQARPAAASAAAAACTTPCRSASDCCYTTETATRCTRSNQFQYATILEWNQSMLNYFLSWPAVLFPDPLFSRGPHWPCRHVHAAMDSANVTQIYLRAKHTRTSTPCKPTSDLLAQTKVTVFQFSSPSRILDPSSPSRNIHPILCIFPAFSSPALLTTSP